ncbi:uncharacterized protein LOC129965408 isoform X2 [Argiope bruennichi]|uniref:uncharacterized protein LOC129965408 isoform X2 n=1 Tax=Argiope bruennichi TaxID=94029 RepID=UPI00249463DC|nr:uncharacterized protein LOC129965408 isoform X2 [Argiope bruennichi]
MTKMWNRKLQKALITLCLAILFFNPAESLQIGGGLKGGSISDLLTVSIIGLALGGLRNRVKQHQSHHHQPQASANHQRPMFLPWQAPPPPQYPMMQPTHVIPSLHPQLIQPQPFFQDISPMLMQLQGEQIYAPMATHLAPSVLTHQALDNLHKLDSLNLRLSDQEWKALESKAIETLLRYSPQ